MSTSTVTVDRVWFGTAQAANYADCSTKTVVRALQSGELKGQQRVAGGRWKMRRDWLDAWLAGEQA